MAKIIVLGAGMVGSAMAIDLAKKHEVTCTDLSDTALQKLNKKDNKVNTLQLDVTDVALLKSTISPFDLVVCAVPGFLGYNTLKHIIEAEKNVIDISFFPENSLDLHNLAV